MNVYRVIIFMIVIILIFLVFTDNNVEEKFFSSNMLIPNNPVTTNAYKYFTPRNPANTTWFIDGLPCDGNINENINIYV